MSKKFFNANDWFKSDQKSSGHTLTGEYRLRSFDSLLADFNSKKKEAPAFNNFFVPGWEGNSLVSKCTKEFTKIIDIIHRDVQDKFFNITNLNTKLKVALYDEFLNYAEFKAINFTGINNHQDLWKEIKDVNSDHKETLQQFINIYTYRTCVIYVLKIRFVAVFLKHSQQSFDFKKIFYPNSFLTSVFRKGSSTELNSSALAQNIFSWYRPDETLKTVLTSLFELSQEISITEIVKNISVGSETILKNNAKYSHSLSHKNFGLFLNSLLINFPLWLSSTKSRFKNDSKTQDKTMDIISCRYLGDYLESMSLSHWLAQDFNKSIKWDQILCPTFKSESFEDGIYVRVINDLQFLTFLAQIANEQGKKPTPFICQVVQGSLKNKKQESFLQKNLFDDPLSTESYYDRVVINLTEYPKNNIQHFIINKLTESSKCLKDNGLIYLLSSKKLFVPSQKNKLQTLLTHFSLEGLFNIEEVLGKGEVSSYLYIFSRNISPQKESKKSSFASFRVSGNLETFQEFEKITQLTHSFFAANLNDVPPIAHKEMNGFNLEFFQDAILDGRMIHASNKDSSKITHPKFFNNLIKTCSPFDHFYNVRSIKEEYESIDNSPIGITTNKISHHSHVMIVDLRNKENAHIEIISPKALEAKVEEYGHSMCSYFEITSKWHNISINALKLFLNSTIGRQICNLTFDGDLKRTKAKLNKLLIPNFIIVNKSIPEHIKSGIELLELDSKDILALHPSSLESQFQDILSFIQDSNLLNTYSAECLDTLARFKNQLEINLDLFELSTKRAVLNFNNPIIKSPLLLSKTSPIYPNNDDIFVEFNTEVNATKIHEPLDSIKLLATSSQESETKTYSLQLLSGQDVVITLFSELEMIQFIEFILSNAIGAPISQVIQGAKTPSLEDLKNILNSFNQMKSTVERLTQSLNSYLEKALNLIISNQ